jgi:hypothetical protein
MLQRRIADAIAAIADEVAVPVTPVIHPGRALDQLINQLVALIWIRAADERFELFRSRDAPGEIEIDAAAEFVIVRQRRVRNAIALHGAEQVPINQIAERDPLLACSRLRQFRGDAVRDFADWRASWCELFVCVFVGEPVLPEVCFCA